MSIIDARVRLRSRFESRGEGTIIRQPIATFVVVRWDDGSESTKQLNHVRPIMVSSE